jgi:hypothetical protein
MASVKVILKPLIPDRTPQFEIHAVPILGKLTLHKLQLKKGALDKFRLPVDVIEGVHIHPGSSAPK